jgi:hypothetical protein
MNRAVGSGIAALLRDYRSFAEAFLRLRAAQYCDSLLTIQHGTAVRAG